MSGRLALILLGVAAVVAFLWSRSAGAAGAAGPTAGATRAPQPVAPVITSPAYNQFLGGKFAVGAFEQPGTGFTDAPVTSRGDAVGRGLM